MKNDTVEKQKRETKFSINGLHKLMEDLFIQSKIDDKSIRSPKSFDINSYSLRHNLHNDSLGKLTDGQKFFISQLESLHEGKHHRIYKITTTTKKEFVLRLPYTGLDTEYAIKKRIESEAATLDFADLKLGLKVPKVLAYGSDSKNSLNTPFIIQEYIKGNTLMRNWNPMVPYTQENHHEEIKKVLSPIQEFQSKLAEIKFNKFGSLYFAHDVNAAFEKPYEGEENEKFAERWMIGPCTERVFSRNKQFLTKSQIDQFTGPWDASNPLDLVKAVADIELENTKTRLALIETDSNSAAGDKDVLNRLTNTFTNLQKLAPVLINTKTDKVKNVDEVFAPRLAHPDLDPLNVLVTEEGEHYLLDFEGSSIKPLIFQSTPRFVAYEDGPKIYEFEIDQDHYKSLTEEEKYHYDFAVIRTRNEVLWELGVNNIFKELGTEGSPVLKRLRGPYVQAIERRSDEEYPLLDRKIYELMLQWDQFAQHGFVLTDKFPIFVNEEIFSLHAGELDLYFEKLGTTPFGVTGGWVPQDMFDSLLTQGVIKKLDNGDFQVQDLEPETSAESSKDSK